MYIHTCVYLQASPGDQPALSGPLHTNTSCMYVCMYNTSVYLQASPGNQPALSHARSMCI